MQFEDFLKLESTPTEPNAALAAAHGYFTTIGHLIPSATFNHWLGGLDLTGVMEDVANDKDHPARHKMASVRLNIMGGEPFNCIQTSNTGRGTIAMIQEMADTTLVAHKVKLLALLSVCINYANEKVYPFKDVNLHEVMVQLKVCPMVPVNTDDGWIVITTLSDCPKHNPQIYGKNPRTNEIKRINNFFDVERAGTYEAQVPREWFGCELFVDDAYGVL